MADEATTVSERTLFQLIYVLPWSTVCIVGILLLWKPEELTGHLQEQAFSMGVDVRTLIVYSLLAVVGSTLLVIGGWKLYLYLRFERVHEDDGRLIYERERNALIALFNSLDGKNWYNKIRWCSDEPIDRWHGVKLDPVTHRVNKLILPENRLAGQIPEELGHLEALIEIDFRRNDIGGELPKSLLTLRHLEGLYLFENRLTGSIPLELAELSTLKGVYLFNNNFENHEDAAKVFREKLPEECLIFI